MSELAGAGSKKFIDQTIILYATPGSEEILADRDLLKLILYYLDHHDLQSLCRVNRPWNRFVISYVKKRMRECTSTFFVHGPIRTDALESFRCAENLRSIQKQCLKLSGLIHPYAKIRDLKPYRFLLCLSYPKAIFEENYLETYTLKAALNQFKWEEDRKVSMRNEAAYRVIHLCLAALQVFSSRWWKYALYSQCFLIYSFEIYKLSKWIIKDDSLDLDVYKKNKDCALFFCFFHMLLLLRRDCTKEIFSTLPDNLLAFIPKESRSLIKMTTSAPIYFKDLSYILAVRLCFDITSEDRFSKEKMVQMAITALTILTLSKVKWFRIERVIKVRHDRVSLFGLYNGSGEVTITLRKNFILYRKGWFQPNAESIKKVYDYTGDLFQGRSFFIDLVPMDRTGYDFMLTWRMQSSLRPVNLSPFKGWSKKVTGSFDFGGRRKVGLFESFLRTI